MTYFISKENRSIKGNIKLDGSKSISNRALIIRALCKDDFRINNCSTSKDSATLMKLLNSREGVLDAGAAGTTFRFLTAYLALQPGDRILTGSARMKQRPIGALVDALNEVGANITYLEQKGFPPLRIQTPRQLGGVDRLKIAAGTSSQYLSALLMIAPLLPNGLTLELEGNIVSRPYLEMTLRQMAFFGVEHRWEGNIIQTPHQNYQPRDFTVEADWSAASYFYALAAFSDECDLRLEGLFSNSSQGDSVLAEMMQRFGIHTIFEENAIRLVKSGSKVSPVFEWDFLPCPDIAQTLAVVCGGLGVQGLFTGLDTLRIKETDRIAALQRELSKVQVHFSKLPARMSKKSGREYYLLEGKAAVKNSPVFSTYEDHRMAMAFAPLAMLGAIGIEAPGVVVKSYPDFWRDLEKLGFKIDEHDA